jgi:hypothetical protein
MNPNKFYNSSWYKLLHKSTKFLSGIEWKGLRALFNDGIYFDLKETDHEILREKLAGSYYIILTNRKCHLTSWLIGCLTFLKTKKWPSYSHVLMNCDLELDSKNWRNFKLIEATNSGVHYSTFMEVFDCDSVCLLEPTNITNEEWNAIIDALMIQNGYQYDDLFDLSDKTHVSCVELVLNALKASPNYNTNFNEFDCMINKVGNLTPQMYLDCKDFKKKIEIKY